MGASGLGLPFGEHGRPRRSRTNLHASNDQEGMNDDVCLLDFFVYTVYFFYWGQENPPRVPSSMITKEGERFHEM